MFALMLDNNNQAQVRASLAVRHRPQPRSRSDRSFPPFFPFFSSVVLHLMLNTIAAKKECHSQQPTTTRSAFGAHHKRHLRTDCSLRAHTLSLSLSLTLVVFSVRDSLGQFLDFFTLSQTIFGRLIADRVPSYTSLISFSLSSRCRWHDRMTQSSSPDLDRHAFSVCGVCWSFGFGLLFMTDHGEMCILEKTSVLS